jgi:hypothetical protein
MVEAAVGVAISEETGSGEKGGTFSSRGEIGDVGFHGTLLSSIDESNEPSWLGENSGEDKVDKLLCR